MNKYTHMAWQTYRNYYKVGLALWCLTPLQLYRGDFTMKNINGVRTNKFIYLFIQIAYYTHMGQAITIQKHANI